MKQYCICIFLLFLVFKGNSQDDIRCATPAYENSLRIKYPGYAKRLQNLEKKIREKNNSHRISATRQEVITIPVVVHVLYNSSNSNISDAKIHAQIKVLNEDFRRLNKDTTNTPATFKSVAGDTKIQFVLSNRDPQGRYTSGIIRKFVSNKSFIVDVSDDDQTLKSISRWPSDAYLNIWVTTLSNFDKKRVLGYTYNPGSYLLSDIPDDVSGDLDGVVINYSTFGSFNPSSKYNMGRTTTHEVGHWLGLRHIFGEETSTCSDDFVNDTPLQSQSNIELNKDECINYSVCNGTKTLDMSDNYMDYSPDKCMNLFTKGQIERMRIVMESNDRRIKIQKSKGYCNIPNPLLLPIFQGFDKPMTDSSWLLKNPVNSSWITTQTGGFGHSKNAINLTAIKNNLQYNGLLETQAINFLDAEIPVLEMSIAYAGNLSDNKDSLVISYNSNCSDFIRIKTLYAKDLISTSFKNNFNPSVDEWKSVKINLSDFLKNRIANIRIQYYGNSLNRLFLDDVNIYDAKDDFQVTIYPNPVFDELTAEIQYKEPMQTDFIIYNNIGKRCHYSIIDTKDFRKVINVAELAAGLYFLHTQIGDKTVIKKFIILK